MHGAHNIIHCEQRTTTAKTYNENGMKKINIYKLMAWENRGNFTDVGFSRWNGITFFLAVDCWYCSHVPRTTYIVKTVTVTVTVTVCTEWWYIPSIELIRNTKLSYGLNSITQSMMQCLKYTRVSHQFELIWIC